MKTCSQCDRPAPGRPKTCGSHSCRNAESREWLQQREDARRLRGKPTPRAHLSRSQRLTIHEAHEWTCHICGLRATPEAAVVDHITPLAHGGSNDLDNLATAHAHCNGSKGSRLLPISQGGYAT